MNGQTTIKLIIKCCIIFVAALKMGFGISMYYFSGLGSDPISTFFEACASLLGIASGSMSIIVNILLFIFALIFKRSLVNIGTFIQAFSTGIGINIGISFWFTKFTQPFPFVANIIISIIGAALIGLSLALYLACDLGASPTDVLVLTICGFIKKSYKWGFYIIYAIFMFLGVLLGGTWGVGTLIALVVTGFVADLLIPRIKLLFNRLFGVTA